jgi:hypothetical protein
MVATRESGGMTGNALLVGAAVPGGPGVGSVTPGLVPELVVVVEVVADTTVCTGEWEARWALPPQPARSVRPIINEVPARARRQPAPISP